ncbi:MAG: glycosyl transferase, group 1 [Microvirga sp.]|nr:glycosyl transferase, group 1 [Microvirga sp.]
MRTRLLTSSIERRPRIALHYWGRRGGGSQFTLFLAQHLAGGDRPADVILSLARQNDDMAAFKASGLPIITMDRPGLATLWREAWSLPGRLRAHAEALAAFRPDAVIMTMNAPFTWPFIRALQGCGIKVFYIAHDAEPHPGDYARTWQRMTQDLLIKRADGVVALSDSVAKQLARRLPDVQTKTSVRALESVFPTHRTQLPRRDGPDEPLRLLFYGRLLPYKGLDVLAQALDPLRAMPTWRLTIAGSGPLEAEVRRIFGNWPQVHLELGWVSDLRAAELFAGHELLVCPYTASLVMPTGALPEQVGFGSGGLVAETSDAAGFREALLSLLAQPDRLDELSRGAAALLAQRQNNGDWQNLVYATIDSGIGATSG